MRHCPTLESLLLLHLFLHPSTIHLTQIWPTPKLHNLTPSVSVTSSHFININCHAQQILLILFPLLLFPLISSISVFYIHLTTTLMNLSIFQSPQIPLYLFHLTTSISTSPKVASSKYFSTWRNRNVCITAHNIHPHFAIESKTWNCRFFFSFFSLFQNATTFALYQTDQPSCSFLFSNCQIVRWCSKFVTSICSLPANIFPKSTLDIFPYVVLAKV